MGMNKWKMNRAGLFNFWYYDDQIYSFADGKMLLRGTNGSGKSVTMQSLITVLLDGRKTPDRLDPFGTKARRMEDYLLGEKEIVDYEERTGYLFLEYKREHTEQYITTGIGLQAKRSGKTDFWGFVLTDNQRIGKDFLLYQQASYNEETGKPEKIPLTRAQLEKQVGHGGQVVRTQKEYMELVNRHVFRFESLAAYEDLVKLLIQLRSPKLSKDFRPTVIYEILNAALPALTDDELRPLSDTIESMEQVERQVKELTRDAEAVKRVTSHYDKYNMMQLVEKAQESIQAQKRYEQTYASLQQHQEEMIKRKEGIAEKEEELAECERQYAVLKKEEQALQTHDVWKAEEEKQRLMAQVQAEEAAWKRKEKELDTRVEREQALHKQLEDERSRLHTCMREMEEVEEEMAELAQEADYERHHIAVRSFHERSNHADVFAVWQKEAMDHKQLIEKVMHILRKQQEQKDRNEIIQQNVSEAQQLFDAASRDAQRTEDAFFAEKEETLNQVYQWIQQHPHMIALSEETIAGIIRTVRSLYEMKKDWTDVKKPIEEAYHLSLGQLNDEKAEIMQAQKQHASEYRKKEQELHKWRNQHDPEPVRHPDVEMTRSGLVGRDIPHVPLYAAVEFYDHVTPAVRERIESALTEMGLLDALIVPTARRVELLADETFVDRIIQPAIDRLEGQTLADYVYATPPADSEVTADDITAALTSIAVESESKRTGTVSTAIAVQSGTYQLSLVCGRAPERTEAIYIGKQARIAYRQAQVERLEQECAELRQVGETLATQWQMLEKRQENMKEAYEQFPHDRKLRETWNEWQDRRKHVQMREAELERQNDLRRAGLAELQRIREQLQQMPLLSNRQLTASDYEAARSRIEDYMRQISELHRLATDYARTARAQQRIEEEIEEIQVEVDAYRGDCYVLRDQMKKTQLLLENIEQRLQLLGADQIRQRIAEVIELVERLPGTIKRLIGQLEAERQKLMTLQEEEPKKEATCMFMHKLTLAWQLLFEKEKARKLLDNGEEAESLTEKDVINKYRSQIVASDGTIPVERIKKKLDEIYYKEQAILLEYRFAQEESVTDLSLPDIPDAVDETVARVAVRELQEKSVRTLLMMDYEGKRVSPYYVQRQIEQRWLEQKEILSHKDQELYEEVIMNSIGKVISERIHRAEKWVKQMNILMSERDTSSGLTFSLSWGPLTANRDDQLDTSEVIELLRADARLITEEDMARIVAHFKSHIEQAKAERADQERAGSHALHHLIKEVLDYRKWFAFTLHFKRQNGSKKALSDNAFYKFSGGEKAMAMYIPLFSAAYSRYLEADASAPYIISLDEAFAGVDENNIRDMFDLVEKLGFDYMMNSQALWGDYDTVSSLAIYELIRPKNAPYVTVIPYRWDGERRYLMGEEGIVDEATSL